MPTNQFPTEKVQVLNLSIDNISKKELLLKLQKGVVFTPNIDHLIKLQHNPDFFAAYQRADYRVCDSRIIQLMSSFFFSRKIKEQIAGSDFFPAFCDFHKQQSSDIRIFLLGGTKDGVAKVEKDLNEGADQTLVVGSYSPPFGFENNPLENSSILEMISQSGANVLAVGLGAPKQELWIDQYKDQLSGIKIFFAIGKTIDFMAGVSRRAPRWMTNIGLEWLYRLGQEPLRLAKRYLIDDMPFFYLSTLQKMGRYRNPWENHPK